MKFEIDKETAYLLERAVGGSEMVLKPRKDEGPWGTEDAHFDITSAPNPAKPWRVYGSAEGWYASSQVEARPSNSCDYCDM